MSRAAKSLIQFPPGTVITDIRGTKWRLDRFMAKGGFGAIYIALINDREFVVKFEFKNSGPLFCEQQFYLRVPQQRHITELETFGLHEHNGEQYRFLVLPRLGIDLQKILDFCGGRLPPPTVFLLGTNLLEALEYIHTKGYTHGDIKAANVVAAGPNIANNNIFLIDFGLAHRYSINGQPKAFKADPKNAHNGTLEFACRDAHKGAPVSPRGDLENLGYCLLQWLHGTLPWGADVANPKATAAAKTAAAQSVAAKKEQYMGDVPTYMEPLLGGAVFSKEFCTFLEEINLLDYSATPPYATFRAIFAGILMKHFRLTPCHGCDLQDLLGPGVADL